MKKILNPLFISVLAFSLIACSGSNSVTNGGSAVSSGSITGFGSIFVNGVEFETNTTNFTIDGQTGLAQSDLQIGMVASVEGSISGVTGTATTVVVEDIVEGPYETFINNNTIIVMGQTVTISTETLFDNNIVPGDINGLTTGDLLEVHGHVTGNGQIAATFIEIKLTAADYEVKGFVTNHDSALQTFDIGALTIDYSGSIITDMPAPGAAAWNNLLVDVDGTTLAAGTLTASKVEPEGLTVTDASKAEIEGFVTAVTSATSLILGNQTIEFSASTVLQGGVASDIIVGTKLEAEGSLVGGILNASKISFRNNVKIEAAVATIGANQLTLSGLPGITVNTNDLTKYRGDLTAFGDITIPSHLRIRGRETAGNGVIATSIEGRSTNSRVILQAPVDSFTNPNVVLLGETVDTSTVTVFSDVNDTVITSTQFFSDISDNNLVKARGKLAGSVVTWDQVDFEE